MAKSKTYEMMLKIAGKADGSLKAACSEAEKNLAAIGNAAKAAAKTAAVVGTAVATAAVAAGKALYDLGSEFDGAYDAIRIGTGATGEALEGLKDSMKAVYGSVPAEMSDAAQAIADYNTRLGVTGETLETLSKQAIQVSDMLGDDLTTVIETSSKAFQQWGVAEENMADTMDYIFKVSQSTGVGFSDLMGNMQSYGAQLQEMGYSFEESAAMLGQLEKAGVNASEVMSAMKKSVTAMAKEGISASDGMQRYYDAIKNAGTATEAISIASEVFGSKAGSTMALAIRDGTLAVSDLTNELLKSTETISGAASDTYSFSEKWQMFTNRMKVALEPMAMSLFDSLSDAMDTLMPAIEAVLPVITSAVNSILPAIEQLIPVISDIATLVVSEIIPVLSEIIATIMPSITELIQGLLPVIMQLVSTVLPPVMSIIKKLLPPLMQIINAILPVVSTLIQALSPVLDALMSALSPILDLVILLIPPIADIISKLSPVISLVGTLVATILESLSPAISFIADLIGTVLNAAFASIGPIIDGVTAIFSGLIDFITNVFSGNWGAAWDAIVGVFGNIFGTIVEIAKMPINAVISAINFCIEKINSISVTIPDWVPLVGGTTIGFNIPTIPQLATGGIVTAPTILEAGEGGEPEAVLPLSKLDAMLQGANSMPQVQDVGNMENVQAEIPMDQLTGPLSKLAAALQGARDMPEIQENAQAEIPIDQLTGPLSKLAAMLQGASNMPQVQDMGNWEDGPEEAPLAKLAKMLDDRTRNNKPGPRAPGQGGAGSTDYQEPQGGGGNDAPQPEGGQNPPDGGVDTITFAPVFNFYGPATPEQAKEAGQISFAEFKRLYQQMKAEERCKNLRASTH